MSTNQELRYVEPRVVAELVTGPQSASTLVLDVRDEDFAAGHVKDAVNVPNATFDDVVDDFIKDKLDGKEKVVVHCQLSQKRGPRCAAILQERLKALGKTQEVVVMKGGFASYGSIFSGDGTLVEQETS